MYEEKLCQKCKCVAWHCGDVCAECVARSGTTDKSAVLVNCKHCSHLNPDGVKYCFQCKKSLTDFTCELTTARLMRQHGVKEEDYLRVSRVYAGSQILNREVTADHVAQILVVLAKTSSQSASRKYSMAVGKAFDILGVPLQSRMKTELCTTMRTWLRNVWRTFTGEARDEVSQRRDEIKNQLTEKISELIRPNEYVVKSKVTQVEQRLLDGDAQELLQYLKNTGIVAETSKKRRVVRAVAPDGAYRNAHEESVGVPSGPPTISDD